MDVRFRSYEDYKATVEMVMKQDDRLSKYAVELVLECMDHTAKLLKFLENEKKKDVKIKNPIVGVDVSSIL